MKDCKIIDIINLCLKIDIIAEQAYKDLAAIAEQQELKSFWLVMAKEEKGHIQLWKKFKLMAENCNLPELFDNPDKVLSELQEIVPKALSLLERCKTIRDTGSSIVVAYSLEFYLLHPALVQLFQVIDSIDPDWNSEEDYEDHINKFVVMMKEYVKETPELELLSETLRRLWEDNKKLATKASTDSLTNIHNRRGFFTIATLMANLANRNKYTSSVLMADLDKFKDTNDTFGHQAGDEVLRTVADIIKSTCRASDTVGRYGGEEFCVFMADVRPDTVRQIADRIRTRIEAAEPAGIRTTISIGAAHSVIGNNVSDSLNALIFEADQNLLEAKKKGRNQVVD